MIWWLLCLIVVLTPSAPVHAQNHYTLEMANPLPSGTAGTGRNSSNRIYRAYQGIEYKIVSKAIGGSPPYTYSLSNAPSGMTVVAGPCTGALTCLAGVITWTNPQATANNITVRATDRDGDWVEATWSITVSTTIGADGFCFIDSVSGNDSTGNGSLATPWQTLAKALNTSTGCGARSILYLRAGTYNKTGITRASIDCRSPSEAVSIRVTESSQPVTWLAYPGESVTVDLTDDTCIDITGSNVYIQGLTINNCYSNCFHVGRTSRYGAQFVFNTMPRTGPGGAEQNAGHIMYKQNYGAINYHDLVSHNTFSGAYTTNQNSCLKFYSILKAVISNNSFYGNNTSECVALKAAVQQFSVIDNKFEDTTANQRAIGGNWSDGTATERGYGEIMFNNILSATDYVLDLNNDGELDAVYVYRNTFAGVPVGVQNLHASIGPFTFTNNVIINAQAASGSCPAKFHCFDLSLTPVDYTRLVLTDNLTGVAADSITDANGALQGSYRTSWLGTRGWELAGISTSIISGSASFTGSVRIQ